jgi:hypothetical protein
MAMLSVYFGSTRIVIVCGPVAVKFPHGQRGRDGNLCEAGVWERNRHHPINGQRLCPVLWAEPAGHLLIMQAAAPIEGEWPPEELPEWDYDPTVGGDGWPGEPKREDWGMLHGKPVLVDYAAAAL